jgi:hypothetical protein
MTLNRKASNTVSFLLLLYSLMVQVDTVDKHWQALVKIMGHLRILEKCLSLIFH